jgi:hypothetical protein
MAQTSRLSQEELAGKLQRAAALVEVGATYVHYKNPERKYLLTGLVLIEATEDVGVIYEAQYEECISFMRPLEDFLAKVILNDVSLLRFTKIQ